MELVFRNENEKQAYRVIINYRGDAEGEASFGELVWTEENGKHTVRSPIVVSPVVHAGDTSLCY